MTQYDLFGGIPPYEKSSQTSKEAALSIQNDAKSLRSKIFNLIAQRGGLTCDEVEEITGMRHQTASARIRELVLENKIRDSQKKRLTRSNRKAVVYVCNL